MICIPTAGRGALQQVEQRGAGPVATPAALLDKFLHTVDLFAGMIAQREGRAVDFAIRCLAGAFIGLTITVCCDAVGDQATD